MTPRRKIIMKIIGGFVILIIGIYAVSYAGKAMFPIDPGFDAIVPALPTATVDPLTWQTYRNEKFGFELRHPTDWEIDDNDDRGISFWLPVPSHSRGTHTIQMSFVSDAPIEPSEDAIGESIPLNNGRVLIWTMPCEAELVCAVSSPFLKNPPLNWGRKNSIFAYYVTREDIEIMKTILSTFQFLPSEHPVLQNLLAQWDRFQPKLGQAGESGKWFLDAAQFIGNNHILIYFEDGLVDSYALVKYSESPTSGVTFTPVKFYRGGSITPDIWNQIRVQYGDLHFPPQNYLIEGDTPNVRAVEDNIIVDI